MPEGNDSRVILQAQTLDAGAVWLCALHLKERSQARERNWCRHVLTQLLTRRPLSPTELCGTALPEAEWSPHLGVTAFTPAHQAGTRVNHPGEYRVVSCWFTDEFVAEAVGHDADTASRFSEQMDVADPAVSRAMIGIAHECMVPGFAGSGRAEALAVQAVAGLARRFGIAVRTEVGAAPRRHLALVRDYAETVTGKRPVIADMARECGVSRAHLMRLFKRATGQPLHDYIEGVRLRRAMTELADGDRHLKEIAFRLGFAGASGFSIAFRRATGMSPRSFREDCRRWSTAGSSPAAIARFSALTGL